MAQPTDVQCGRRTADRDDSGRVIGFGVGRLRGTEAGWYPPRDGAPQHLAELPPRGTVRGNWEALACPRSGDDTAH